jgi:chemotaxis protein MotA
MELNHFWDPVTLGIVGTLLATVLRVGWAAAGATVAQMLAPRARFDADGVRAELARVVQEVARNGLLRTEPRSTGDAEFDAALGALVGQRSMDAMRKVLASARAARMAPAESAIRTLMQAAELAPVFGLAGTLISLSKLPGNGIDRSAYMGAIGMAVHATLYGLVLANLLLSPVARWVERRARREEVARQAIIDWFDYELACAFPQRPGVALHPAHFSHPAQGPQAGEDYEASVARGGGA